MPLRKGQSNSGIKNLVKFEKGKSGYNFPLKDYTCIVCGLIYQKTAAYSKYCSVQCSEKARKKSTYTCQICNSTFHRRNTKRCRNGNVLADIYCSVECHGIARSINGTSNYQYKAFLLKEEIKCERCGIDDYEVLHVHHKDRNRKNANIDNLEILCANCHTKEHYKEFKERSKNIEFIMYIKQKSPETIAKIRNQ